MMYVLLQILPEEAAPDDRSDWIGVEVLAVNENEDELTLFMDEYRDRHDAAVKEWDAWDVKDDEWSDQHDRKFDELCDKWNVLSVINNINLKIVKSNF